VIGNGIYHRQPSTIAAPAVSLWSVSMRPAGRKSASSDKYGAKPGPTSGSSNEPLTPRGPLPPPAFADQPPVELQPRAEVRPVEVRPPVELRPRAEVRPPIVVQPARSDLTRLLGRTVLEARVQQTCREWGLVPYQGRGLSRSYLAREVGVELAADAQGVVTAIFLHYDGDDGFRPFTSEVPGAGAAIGRRTQLWATLGRPWESVDPFLGDYGPSDTWLLSRFVLNARYSPDAEHVQRITLTLPASPRAA
jgi:hypothetical protein